MAEPVETESDRIFAFKQTLKDLTFNSKPHIIMLTELALAESHSESAATGIASVIESRIREVRNQKRTAAASISRSDQKSASKLDNLQIALLYLIDSIVKNDKNPDHRYLNLFTQNIVSNFCELFKLSDELFRSKLYKLRGTWIGIFPDDKLSALDRRIKSLDPAWPVWPKSPAGSSQTSSQKAAAAAAAATSAPAPAHVSGNGLVTSGGHAAGPTLIQPQQQVHFNRNFFEKVADHPKSQPQPQQQQQPVISETQKIRQETLKRLQEEKAIRQRQAVLAKRKLQQQQQQELVAQQQHQQNFNNSNTGNNRIKKQKMGRGAGGMAVRSMREQGMPSKQGRSSFQQQQHQMVQMQQQPVAPVVVVPVPQSAIITPSNQIYSRRPVIIQHQQPFDQQQVVPFPDMDPLFDHNNHLIQHQQNHQFHQQQQLLRPQLQQQQHHSLQQEAFRGSAAASAASIMQSNQYQMVTGGLSSQSQQQAQVPAPHSMLTSATTGMGTTSTNNNNHIPSLLSSLTNSNNNSSSQSNPLQSVFDLLRLSNKSSHETEKSAGLTGSAGSATTGGPVTSSASASTPNSSQQQQRISPIPGMFMNEPVIEWTSESLRIKRASISAKLYNGQQCSSCSERFKRQDKDFYSMHPDLWQADCKTYENHVQWHYRQNNAKRNRSGKAAQSRPWYYKLSDWLQFKEINDELGMDQPADGSATGTGADGSDEEDGEVRTIPARPDPSDNVCNVCHEKFESQFREEDEQWILLNALLHEDLVYHPACLQDFLKNDNHPDTSLEQDQMDSSVIEQQQHQDDKGEDENQIGEQEKEQKREKEETSASEKEAEQKGNKAPPDQEDHPDVQMEQVPPDEHDALNYEAEEEEEEEVAEHPEEEMDAEQVPSSPPPAGSGSAGAGDAPDAGITDPAINVVMRGSETSAACILM